MKHAVRADAASRGARDLGKAPLATPGNLGENAAEDISGRAYGASGRHVRPLHEDQELPFGMSRVRVSTNTTSRSTSRRPRSSPRPTRSPSARATGGTALRSIGHIARLQRAADNDADWSPPTTCWPSSRKTTAPLRDACARRMTYATSTATSPRRACLKTGSIRPSAGSGSCSRPAGADGGSGLIRTSTVQAPLPAVLPV